VATKLKKRGLVVAGAVAVAAVAAVAIPALASGSDESDDLALTPVSNTQYTGNGNQPVKADGYGRRGDVFVLTADNRLRRIDNWGAGKTRLDVAITGLAAGEKLVGLDTRPANGQLYGVGSTSRLYVIDPASGVATPVGAVFSTPLSGTHFGVDFNPTVDRLRIVSNTGQNLRIDPTTGAVAGVDTALSFPAGGAPTVTAAAYTNSVAGATGTTLYDLDSGRDSLVTQGTAQGVTPVISPNTGQLLVVGKLGVDIDGVNGFDIIGTGKDTTALAAVQVKGEQKTTLVRIDLKSGKASRKGNLPAGITGFTASAGTPQTVYATTKDNELVRLDRGLKVRARTPITGLAAGEKVLGIDFRPANGQLYAVGSTNRVYVVNVATGAATAVGTGPFTPALNGVAGVDFNPTVDRLRVVTTTGQNLRINPDTGAVASTDGTLNYAADDANAGKTPKVSYAAYTNNQAGATTTTLYDLDSGLDVLDVQAPPNDGVLRTTGKLRVDAGDQGGFDIGANGVALAAIAPAGADRTRIYAIDLATGQAHQRASLGKGLFLTGLAIAPRGV
jgi:hypothetical protein